MTKRTWFENYNRRCQLRAGRKLVDLLREEQEAKPLPSLEETYGIKRIREETK
jgi:hypothetical protein